MRNLDLLCFAKFVLKQVSLKVMHNSWLETTILWDTELQEARDDISLDALFYELDATAAVNEFEK